ncbi:branched-chain-amino-acid cytosolic-like isoform X1 [Labeo rohita]|uniref:Branched-chain-amino-acid cytosolic-like isoform X1 n=1 Tax=Labeo rohita TaxID=84645 RepID=A0A498MAB5_LABRO|nr:branched-chain-amino-acid cytosolic-like isoform X1 [Labeo rohita]
MPRRIENNKRETVIEDVSKENTWHLISCSPHQCPKTVAHHSSHCLVTKRVLTRLEEGWQKPHIQPFGNLSTHPGCSSLHYAAQIGRLCASSAIQQTIAMSVKEPWGISTSGHYRAPGHASAEARSHSLAVQKS